MIDPRFWRGRKVLITGHTGFKGAWTCLLLNMLGAEVDGVALAPTGSQDLFVAAKVDELVGHCLLDVRHGEELLAAVRLSEPEIILHMAAQSLVRQSYLSPIETYAINVMGTVHLLDAVRRIAGIRAVVVITSDKCYANSGSQEGYRETDPMGGHDPYSNSKGCAELVTDAYRRSFFGGAAATPIASGRAGNVIGGGDWSPDRLVPDAIRAFRQDVPLRIRNPSAIRPWQHVLDPVIGYLRLAEGLVADGSKVAEGWNFGPAGGSEVAVERVVSGLAKRWSQNARWECDTSEQPHEAAILKLDCTSARTRLGWEPIIELEQALDLTVDWYKAQAAGLDMRRFTREQIQSVLTLAIRLNA